MQLNPIEFKNNECILLDQRKLPAEELYVSCKNIDEVILAIKEMVVRGAPCIGFTAIYGLALWIKSQSKLIESEWIAACQKMKDARPTAVNLMYETDICQKLVLENATKMDISTLYQLLINHGNKQLQLSEEKNFKMGMNIVHYLKQTIPDKKLKVMTHCNTGRLACGSIGTALGVIELLKQENLLDKVWVDETRPYMQGSRLTSFELSKANIEHEIVVEGAASYLMSRGLVDAIFVGADRIAANGDTANKVGTSTLAIVAKNYNVPFFVVAPLSSFDFALESGKQIEIELRDPNEILQYKSMQIAPLTSKALNPSFDVTWNQHITGISCESGLVINPNLQSMKELIK